MHVADVADAAADALLSAALTAALGHVVVVMEW